MNQYKAADNSENMSYWERPNNIPYPNVWLRFKAKDLDSDNLVQYRIQDVTEQDFDAVYENMKAFFFHDEPLNFGCRLVDDVLAHKEIYDDWKQVIKQKLSLVCYKEDTNEVVGCSLLRIKIKGLKSNEDPKVCNANFI